MFVSALVDALDRTLNFDANIVILLRILTFPGCSVLVIDLLEEPLNAEVALTERPSCGDNWSVLSQRRRLRKDMDEEDSEKERQFVKTGINESRSDVAQAGIVIRSWRLQYS